jgi:hypothetical protein
MALHHPDSIAKYQNNRFFASCDSVGTNIDLASLIASHLGLNLGSGNIIKLVVQNLSSKPACLLVLDNLESAWERRNHEEMLKNFFPFSLICLT